MFIKLHGGACCGIKHIHELGSNPDFMLGPREALVGEQTSFNRRPVTGVNDAHADDYPEDFFCEAAPQEKRTDRLDRLLAFLKTHRSRGIVEIVLVASQSDWFPVLEGRGFRKVTMAVNGNTARTLHVFHLVME